jgi:hypothetical protein
MNALTPLPPYQRAAFQTPIAALRSASGLWRASIGWRGIACPVVCQPPAAQSSTMALVAAGPAFELDRRHIPRLLHRQSERGYTNNPRDAVPDEPEAVDAATQTRITAEARRRDTVRRGWLDQQLLDERASLEHRLDRARELARRRGIDVRQDVRIIERRILAIERKVTRQGSG